MNEASKKGRLFLIPTPLWEGEISTIPDITRKVALEITCYAVENLRSGRRFLKALDSHKNIDDCTFFEIDKHGKYTVDKGFFDAILVGKDGGILSEAGCPCIADPGFLLVKEAHAKGIQVIPLVGPNSVIMALMASGLNGQYFHFHGYLPIEKEKRIKMIRNFGEQKHAAPQIFIETPYRNQGLLEDLLRYSGADTELCIACDITAPEQFILTKTIHEWSKGIPDIQKKPTVFIILPPKQKRHDRHR